MNVTTVNYTLDGNAGPQINVNDFNGAIEAISERERYSVANGIAQRVYTLSIESCANQDAPGAAPEQVIEPAAAQVSAEPVPSADTPVA